MTKCLMLGDVINILQWTEDLSVNGRYSPRGYYTQLFLFSLLEFYKTQGFETLDLPFKTISMFLGASKDSAKRLKDYCRKKALIVLVHEPDRLRHISSAYRLKYKFCENPPIVATLHDAIRLLYSREQIFELYPAFIAKRILNSNG